MASSKSEIDLMVRLAKEASATTGGQKVVRAAIRKYKDDHDISRRLLAALQGRSVEPGEMLLNPVDRDSRMPLVLPEFPVQLHHDPVWSEDFAEQISSLLLEWKHESNLMLHGLAPDSTVMLVGEPGVGKTMTARWLAKQLGWPILILDLSTIFNSHLGVTSENLRHVFEAAKKQRCVLLLDEIDTIGQSRSLTHDVGEMRRMTPALMQLVDGWSDNGILIGATNHSETLDTALQNRFQRTIHFPRPSLEMIEKAVRLFLPSMSDCAAREFSESLKGKAFRDIEFICRGLLKKSVLQEIGIDELCRAMANGNANCAA